MTNEFDELLLETTVKNEKYVINAYIANEHVGHVAYDLGENEVRISTMGVAPFHERRGIARLMVEHIINHYSGFTIHSGASNAGSRGVLESLGFTATDEYLQFVLKRDMEKLAENNSIPPSQVYQLPKVMVKVISLEDIETICQMAKGNLEILRYRLDHILSCALENEEGYSRADYTELYNMIEEFMESVEAKR